MVKPIRIVKPLPILHASYPQASPMKAADSINPQYMQHAINLALQASRKTLPNPCVGAVLVYKDTILAEGYHQAYGAPHAEPNAINAVSDRALLAESTLYVTLEPCAHYGKTPPCADLIVATKIPRVVVGCRDPFPDVSGKGIEKLLSAQVSVVENVLHDRCVVANKRFILAHTARRPYIILKWAQTEDGYLAPEENTRYQISSPESQQLTHYWRGQEMAILVGANTARIDNPLLTVRHTARYQQHELPALNPERIILAGQAPLPNDLLVWNADAKSLLFTPTGSLHRNIPSHIERHPLDDSRSYVRQVCDILYKRSTLSVLVEGGGKTLQAFIDAGLWDEMRVFVAPIRFGRGVPAPRLNEQPRNLLQPAAASLPQATSLQPEQQIQSGIDTLKIYSNPELRRTLGVGHSVQIT
jgi:diaminohydroxyphosphoribosylaminopyrimidine deaminase/5-amino-6-(5-phosphoribosylamino)uracil reductase